MASTLGEIVLKLSASTAAFARDLDKARSDVDRLTKGMQQAFAGVQKAAGAFGVSLGALQFTQAIKRSIDFADALNDLSARTGITTETLSVLDHVARKSGANLEGVATGLKQLAKFATEAATGNAEAAKVFKALQVSVRDANGALRPAEALLGDVAKAVSSIPDPTLRSALAQKVFGKAGDELVPTLLELKGGFASVRTEVERLGGLVNDKFAKDSDRFNDQIEELSTRARGLANSLAGVFLRMLDVNRELGKIRSGQLDTLAQKLGIPQKGAPGAASPFERFMGAEGFAFPGLVPPPSSKSILDALGDPKKVESLKVEIVGLSEAIERLREASGLPPGSLLRPGEIAGGARIGFPGITEVLAGMQTPLGDIPGLMARVLQDIEMRAPRAGAEIEKMAKTTDDLRRHVVDMRTAFGQAFEDAALRARSFTDVLRGLGDEILRIFLRMSVIEPLFGEKGSFTGLFSKLLGGLNFGHRALGGPVFAGQPYMVGERGPEMFVPHQSGSIVPNHAMGGGQIIINQDNRGSDLGAGNRAYLGLMRAADAIAKANVLAMRERGMRTL